MAQIDDLIKEIEFLQKETNDAVVKKETAISKRDSILSDIEELKKKSQDEFGCSVEELQEKKEEYSKEIQEKILKLKQILGIVE